MKNKVIVDTGPLVALLNGTDSAHGWVMQQLSSIAPPMLTCEAVLAEATYLTRHMPGARAALIEMIGDGFLSIGMAVADHHSALLGSESNDERATMAGTSANAVAKIHSNKRA